MKTRLSSLLPPLLICLLVTYTFGIFFTDQVSPIFLWLLSVCAATGAICYVILPHHLLNESTSKFVRFSLIRNRRLAIYQSILDQFFENRHIFISHFRFVKLINPVKIFSSYTPFLRQPATFYSFEVRIIFCDKSSILNHTIRVLTPIKAKWSSGKNTLWRQKQGFGLLLCQFPGLLDLLQSILLLLIKYVIGTIFPHVRPLRFAPVFKLASKFTGILLPIRTAISIQNDGRGIICTIRIFFYRDT